MIWSENEAQSTTKRHNFPSYVILLVFRLFIFIFLQTGLKWSQEKPSSPSFFTNSSEEGITAKITLPRFPGNAKYV